MIEYIVTSYVVMFFLCFYYVVFDGEGVKENFKCWVASPVMLPLFLIGKFINW